MQQRVLITPPTVEPVRVDEMVDHMRLHTGLNEDAYLQDLITAARGYIETITNRQLITATWEVRLSGFPGSPTYPLQLLPAPVASVTSVTYVDDAGASQVWPTNSYQVDLAAEPAEILPGYQVLWPMARDVVGAVKVRFVAGYGSTGSSVPASLRHLIKLLVAHWYEHREPVITGTTVNQLPMAIESLLWQHRLLQVV